MEKIRGRITLCFSILTILSSQLTNKNIMFNASRNHYLSSRFNFSSSNYYTFITIYIYQNLSIDNLYFLLLLIFFSTKSDKYKTLGTQK